MGYFRYQELTYFSVYFFIISPKFMDILKDILQRCQQRHTAPLRQRQTTMTPALSKDFPYQFNVNCARGTRLPLDYLEQANISFMPIGHAPENDYAPRDAGGERYEKRQTAIDWGYRRLYNSWGIQIYTGIPSGRNNAHWHDIEITYNTICAKPQQVITCIGTLLKITSTPLLTMTKSGGLRFSCRIPNYLYPDTRDAPFMQADDTSIHHEPYLEIRGDKSYSRWDTRYEILVGNLLYPPIVDKDALFETIETFYTSLHNPTSPVVSVSLGSDQLNLARDALQKRGFCYDRKENDFYYWCQDDDVYIALWEDQGIVWIRACSSHNEIPIRAVPITDIWDDTGISQAAPNQKMLAIRNKDLSPLAIKRLPAKLHKPQTSQETATRDIQYRVFQLRTSSKVFHSILHNHANANIMELSIIGERYFRGIRSEINNHPKTAHAIITNRLIHERLTDLTQKPNVAFVTHFNALDTVDFESPHVYWIVGTPYWEPGTIWKQVHQIFGNNVSFNYDVDLDQAHYQDTRIQHIHDQNIEEVFAQLVNRLEPTQASTKTVIFLTNFFVPDITNRQQTLLFDWVDLEIAGSLDKLPEIISAREHYETKLSEITENTDRTEVEHILGSSARTANRLKRKLRGNMSRTSLREQILNLLSTGEKKASLLAAAMNKSPPHISNVLRELLEEGVIVRVKRGVYQLKD